MRKRFHVAYEIITPESAEHSDAAERGFMTEIGPVELPDGVCGKPAGDIKALCALSLRQAVQLVSVGGLEDSGRWFSEIDGRNNYKTGAEERRSFHPPDNVTACSYARIARLLGVKPLR